MLADRSGEEGDGVETFSSPRRLAVRIAGLDQPNLGSQYWDMIRATNLEEFERALARMQMPMFNVIYADRDGRILNVTIASGAPLNAVNTQLHEELGRVFADLQDDPDSDLLVLTGEG